MIPMISFDDGQKGLDWLALTDALAAGHRRPKAQIGDTFLYRGDDTLLSRAAWIDGLGIAVKTATIFPGNTAQSSINGGVMLYSDAHGVPEAVIDFHLVTKWKTAGDTLLAARHLARPDSEAILVVGAGTVAASLAEAYRAVFPKARILIWNRTEAAARRLADQHGLSVASDLEQAVRHADVVATATMTKTPLILGDWLRPGQHLDLIGAYRPDMREVDDGALQRARVFVDSFETTVGHIGEIEDPLARGVIKRTDLIADFYDLERFNRAPGDITICKNGGGAHLDLMTARYILDRWSATDH